MSLLAEDVRWLWAFSTISQAGLFTFLILKGNFRKLPVFTTYVALNLCQAGYLAVLYSLPRMQAAMTAKWAWDSEFVTLMAQALATTEVLRIALQPYKGIWGLGWRALALVSVLVAVLVAMETFLRGVSAGWLELNRDYHLTFATAVIACLLVVRYYSIPVPAPYKMILGGFCVYSCTEILIYTILQPLFRTHFSTYTSLWQFGTVFSFLVVQLLWLAALRHPLPAAEKQLPEISDSTYDQLSPEINEQLRLLNEKLLRLWKLEARPR